MQVREATLDDVARVLAIVRASITELCTADHGDDPVALEAWLANKTPEQVARWLADPDLRLLVAELDGVVRGVASLGRRAATGSTERHGELYLCYVEPGFVGRGLGRALLAALEAVARAWGLEELRLESTTVAQAFYAAHGYEPAPGCSSVPRFGRVTCRPFTKRLTV